MSFQLNILCYNCFHSIEESIGLCLPEITELECWDFGFTSSRFVQNFKSVYGKLNFSFCQRNNNGIFISSDNCSKLFRLHLELLTKRVKYGCFLCHFYTIYISETYVESTHFYWQYAQFILKDEHQNRFEICLRTRSISRMYL